MVIIKSEKQLRKTLQLIKSGDVRLLILNGSGGTGKSTTVETELPTAMYIKGHLTPLKLYIDIYNHKPTYLVIDDVDELFKSKIMTSLLKQLTDSGVEKMLNYASTHAKLNGIPGQIDVSHIKGIVIITNDDLSKSSVSTLKALMTRAITLTYEPIMQEVESIASTFCSKSTINFFNDYLITTNSLRNYKLMDNLNKAGFNLYEQVDTFSSMLSPYEQQIVYLLSTHKTKEAAIKKFSGDKATFNTLFNRIKAKRVEYLRKKKEGLI